MPPPNKYPQAIARAAVKQARKPHFENTVESFIAKASARSWTPPNILDFMSEEPLSYDWSWKLWWKPIFFLCFCHGALFSVEAVHAKLDAESLDKFNQITSTNSSQLFDLFWINHLPQWLTIIRTSLAFLGIVGIGWYAVWLARKSDKVGTALVLDLVLPIVVVSILLSGNLLASSANSVRQVLMDANTEILKLANAESTIEQAETLKGYSAIMSTQIAQCDGQPPGELQDTCLKNASETIDSFIANDEQKFGNTPWLKEQKERAKNVPISGTVDAGGIASGGIKGKTISKNVKIEVNSGNPLDSLTPEALAATFMTAIEKGLLIILDQLIEAFSFALQALYVLDALLLPIALLLALSPMQAQAILAWILSMVSIGAINIFYFIIVAIAADLLLGSNGLLSILFALVAGVIAPVFAVFLAGGGGVLGILGILQFASHAANGRQGA